MFKIKIISPIHGEPFVERETQAEVDAYITDPEILAHWGEGTTFEVEDITAKVEQEQINKEAREYLAKTDWYAIRFAETGIPVSEEIAQQRQAARASVVES